MSWITIIGSMSAACCLTLAAVHLLVLFRTREAWTSLLFSISAAAAAAMAALDLLMLRAQRLHSLVSSCAGFICQSG
jgi:hypothetical protein